MRIHLIPTHKHLSLNHNTSEGLCSDRCSNHHLVINQVQFSWSFWLLICHSWALNSQCLQIQLLHVDSFNNVRQKKDCTLNTLSWFEVFRNNTRVNYPQSIVSPALDLFKANSAFPLCGTSLTQLGCTDFCCHFCLGSYLVPVLFYYFVLILSRFQVSWAGTEMLGMREAHCYQLVVNIS